MAEVMNNPGGKLFETWGKYVEPIVGEGAYSYGVSSKIANDKKLYARIFVMGNTSGTMDLQNNEISTNLAVQCETFSTIGLNKAYEVDDASHQAMVDMGFHRTYGADITENVDSSIIRVISRYRRTYTGYFQDESIFYDVVKDTDGNAVLDSSEEMIAVANKEE